MNPALLIVVIVLAAIAALLHVYIFIMESVWWGRPAIWKRFGIGSQGEADTIKPMALNQGFYNLFLAIGVVVGFILLPHPVLQDAGLALIGFATASMLAASLVLVISNPKMLRAAVTQGFFPLLALIAVVILGVTTVTATA